MFFCTIRQGAGCGALNLTWKDISDELQQHTYDVHTHRKQKQIFKKGEAIQPRINDFAVAAVWNFLFVFQHIKDDYDQSRHDPYDDG